MRTSSPGPPGQANAASWRRWLFPGTIAAFFVTLFALPRGAAAGMPLTYTQFVADLGAGTVRAVTIGPTGPVPRGLARAPAFTPPLPGTRGAHGPAASLSGDH